ncbi:Uncharacterized protein HZ326_19145 [Fusarium oxysporum f. sp. albedinis]|nr:Uncharacterized protein HZ326_19145 [Fusarium oxysporum f. sp. albedinis]
MKVSLIPTYLIRTYSAKIHSIKGRAKISTLPRPRTYIATRATNTFTASQSETCTTLILERAPIKKLLAFLKAIKLLERGYLGRATRALIDPTLVALNTAENRAILLEKHPIGFRDPFQGKTRPRPS